MEKGEAAIESEIKEAPADAPEKKENPPPAKGGNEGGGKKEAPGNPLLAQTRTKGKMAGKKMGKKGEAGLAQTRSKGRKVARNGPGLAQMKAGQKVGGRKVAGGKKE